MRISELISMLNKAQGEHGDIDIAVGQTYWDEEKIQFCNSLHPEITLNVSSNYAYNEKYYCSGHDDLPQISYDIDDDEPSFHTGAHCLVIGYKGPNWFVLNDASEQYKLRLQEYKEMLRREQKALDARMSVLCAALAKTGG